MRHLIYAIYNLKLLPKKYLFMSIYWYSGSCYLWLKSIKNKLMKKIIPVALFALFITSCGTMSKIKTTDVDNINKTGILAHPIIAEVEIKNTKIAGQYIMKSEQYKLNKEYGKNMAIADAVKKAGCDYLVHPMYEIIIETRNTTINVTGFPSKYKEFRKMLASDSTVIKLSQKSIINNESGTIEIDNTIVTKKKRKF